MSEHMTPELQHTASIANLLACIDGSVHRTCLECGQMFKASSPTSMRCEPCLSKEEENACCDSPHYRTIRSAECGDGTVFATIVCEGCGRREQVEL